ncbi:hypothetical protein PM082_021522 [Marasmius tenuissimus]|nr:hypothetical protein PM082_021522 [Marasmius tenuissimus]
MVSFAAEQADEENPHALHELGLLHESGPGVSPTMRIHSPRPLPSQSSLHTSSPPGLHAQSIQIGLVPPASYSSAHRSSPPPQANATNMEQ